MSHSTPESQVKNHPIYLYGGALITGFAAAFAMLFGGMQVFGRTIVSADDAKSYQTCKNELQQAKLSPTLSEATPRGSTEIVQPPSTVHGTSGSGSSPVSPSVPLVGRVSKTVPYGAAVSFEADVSASVVGPSRNGGTEIRVNGAVYGNSKPVARFVAKTEKSRICYVEFMGLSSVPEVGGEPTAKLDYFCKAK